MKTKKLGRKRVYPLGSITLKTTVSPRVVKALEEYLSRQSVRPRVGDVIAAALEAFLTGEVRQ